MEQGKEGNRVVSEPKRYSIVADYQAPWAKMHEFNAGGWVKWEDYARLKAEVERLTDCKAGADRLKAEVERLRKAGDAMALCITEFRCGKYGIALDKVGGFYVWQDWLAAKEGKQSK